MNQDFLLPGSAGMARRLVKLSKIADINLDPEIEKLAQTNLLGDTDFEAFEFQLFTPAERAAIQSLIDYDLRALLPGPNGPRVALAAIKLGGFDKITILTGSAMRKQWEGWIKGAGITDAVIVTKFQVNESLNDRRDGVLLVDVKADAVAFAIFARDFPKTIALSNHRVLMDAADRVSTLFSGSPHDLFTNPAVCKEIERNFKTRSLFDMAFLANIVTDILNQPTNVNAPDDGANYGDDDDEDGGALDGLDDLLFGDY